MLIRREPKADNITSDKNVESPKPQKEISNVKLNENDTHDSELADNPDCLGEEGEDAANQKLKLLEAQIEKNKKGAEDAKKLGKEIEMALFEASQKIYELKKQELLKRYPKLGKGEAQKEQKNEEEKKTIKISNKITDPRNIPPEDIESLFHNIEKLQAVSVLDEEISIMMKKSANSPSDLAELYTDKKDQAEMKKQQIITMINCGLLTQEKYFSNLAGELVFEQKLLSNLKNTKANDEDIIRVEKRIELIKQEQAQDPSRAEKPANEIEEEKKEIKKVEQEKVLDKEPENIPKEPINKETPIINDIQTLKEEEEGLLNTAQPELKSNVSFNPEDLVIEDSQPIDWAKVNKEQYDFVLNRLTEYRNAFEFLQLIGLIQKADLLKSPIHHLAEALSLVKKGKKINIVKVEAPLTPEKMYAEEQKDKVLAIESLIRSLQDTIKMYENNAKSVVAAGKKGKDPTKLQKIMQEAKAVQLQIAKLKANIKDEWQPVPKYHIETLINEKEIIQEEIKSTEVAIEYKADPNMAPLNYLTIKYTITSKFQNIEGTFDGNLSTTIKIPYEKGIKHIEQAEITLQISGRSLLVFRKTRGSISFKLDKFASQGKIQTKLPYNRNKYDITVTFMIRQPTITPEILQTEYKQLIIDRIYPSYKPQKRAANTSKSTAIPEQKRQTQAAKTQSIAPSAPKPPGNPPQIQRKEEPMPQGITEVDVKDPDNIGNLVCVSYLKKRMDVYTKAVKEISEKGEPIPKMLKDKLNDVTKNYGIITSQIQNQKLTPENYKKYLELQMQKDNILRKYLENIGQTAKAKIVIERLQCITTELKSFAK